MENCPACGSLPQRYGDCCRCINDEFMLFKYVFMEYNWNSRKSDLGLKMEEEAKQKKKKECYGDCIGGKPDLVVKPNHTMLGYGEDPPFDGFDMDTG